MEITILGSGGCTVIPKPLCRCDICEEARIKGIPYARSGPSTFIHDENILIDTPADIATQLNRSTIKRIDYLILTHLDPDHVEGFRVVEQITLDFRSWRAYPAKQIVLLVPHYMTQHLQKVQSVYGSLMDFYEGQGFIKSVVFRTRIQIGTIQITAIPIDRGTQISSIYIFEAKGWRMVYASCDLKPFPEDRKEVQQPDLFVVQPGIFEDGLKHDFTYPRDHISRTTLYTFEQTMALAHRIQATRVLFVHLEEYWNRSYDDYLEIEKRFENVQFAYDGMQLKMGSDL